MFNKFENYVKQPSFKQKMIIYSDGNDDYRIVLPEYYHEDSLSYGQVVKHKCGIKLYPPLLRKVYGNPDWEDFSTNSNESFNSILRGRLARLIRRTKCHSKGKFELSKALSLFQFYWNFIHIKEKKLTPAIMEGQTKKLWTWGNFLHAQLRVRE